MANFGYTIKNLKLKTKKTSHLCHFDFNKLCEKTAKTNILMLNAKECPSGRMPVIIGNGFGGVLFHEACGHPLEASAVSKNLSCFSGKLGEAIASPIVNAFDDATIPNAWGSFNVDDEGHSPHKTQLIKNGICMDYLIGEDDNLFNPFISLLSFTSKILMAYPPASTVFIFNFVL